MNLVENITEQYDQVISLEFSRGLVQLNLIYSEVVGMWRMNVTFTRADSNEPERPINGVKLALSTTHFQHRNWPFDFAVVDTTGTGVDPYAANDFAIGRCELYFVTPKEMILIRGVDVR
ncbi:hypothetical protein NVP1052A_18 [Vibrio phage 1.052.A._10N.286.46.C3]|nr:hypothetical protein NVP1052A_18 [Vibrio phage 1.052.A._10N.286.46.C3]